MKDFEPEFDADSWGPFETKVSRFLIGMIFFFFTLLTIVQLCKWLGV